MMKGTKIFLFTAAAILFILADSANAYYYTVIDLGNLCGESSNRSQALSVSNNAQAVGFDWCDTYHACRFDPTGGGANIDLYPGGAWSVAYSINDSNQIVGYAGSSPSTWRACLFDPTGGGISVDLDPCGTGRSYAFSINNNGQVVGQTNGRACLYDTTGEGNNIDLGTLSGEGSTANYINDNGQIVGQASSEAYDHPHACLFDPTGDANNNIDLGTLSGGNDRTNAYCINNNGLIVGTELYDEDYTRACLFDPTGEGNNINLGYLGGENAGAHSINDSNQIVGYAENSTGFGRACLFDPTGQGNNIDLNTLIDPASGWTLTMAYSINNDGWIVGYGTNPDEKTHAYLLKPPVCTEELEGDFNDDCKVNFIDFALCEDCKLDFTVLALIVNDWLKCNLDPQSACWD